MDLKRGIFGVLVVASACANASTSAYQTPASIDPAMEHAYPLDANWQLLGIGKGESCITRDRTSTNAVDPEARGNALFQAAKFNAIESVPDADNLLYIRSRRETSGGKDCVYVTGRAYKLTSVRARPPEAAMGGK